MLENKQEQAVLFNLLLNGNTLEAFHYLQTHMPLVTSSQVDYFFGYYLDKIYKKSFFELWENILKSNFDTPPLSIRFKNFIEKSCLHAIYLQDKQIVLTALFNQKTQAFILESLVANDLNNHFTLSILKDLPFSSIEPQLLILSIQFFNAELIQILLNNGTPTFNLPDNQTQILQDLYSIAPPKAHFMHQQMRNFAHGFGHIKHADILLTLAQIKSRKSYNFHPLAVNEEEFDNFFKYIASQSIPVSIKFIVTGEHSYCGEISLDTHQKASVYLIDSMGISIESAEYHHQFIEKMSEYLDVKQVYINHETRQYSTRGCSIFALDDLQHLYQLRLPPEYANIWDYLEKKSSINTTILENIDLFIHTYPLPMPFLRTMQTNKLLSDVIPKRLTTEPNYPINKKGQTIFDAAKHFFKKENDLEKPLNFRLMYKLDKMRLNNWEFLKKYSVAQIETLKSEFAIPNSSSCNFSIKI